LETQKVIEFKEKTVGYDMYAELLMRDKARFRDRLNMFEHQLIDFISEKTRFQAMKQKFIEDNIEFDPEETD
jgi:hypothetical protein